MIRPNVIESLLQVLDDLQTMPVAQAIARVDPAIRADVANLLDVIAEEAERDMIARVSRQAEARFRARLAELRAKSKNNLDS